MMNNFNPNNRFSEMVTHALDYAKIEKAKGKKIIGIMCEFTPREIIMAAGAVPVCLCGGSAETIPSAESFLPVNLCPLIKSTFGYSVEKANPFLGLSDLIVAETTCDGKKKMFELLEKNHEIHVLELTQKSDDKDALDHWINQLKELKTMLEIRYKTTISDTKLRNAIKKMNLERRLRRELAALMKDENPPLTGRELLDFKSLISCIPEDLIHYEKALHYFKKKMTDSLNSSGIRVLLTGVPLPHGAERVLEIIESNGGLVVCQENCTGIKPLLEDVSLDNQSPLQAIAEKYFHLPCSVMTKNTRRFDSLKKLIKEYSPDCVIELTWQACLTYDIESGFVKELVEKEAGLPYLHIETDYSPSDTSRISLRIQALFETIVRKKT